MTTLKERIENNLTLYTLTIAAAAFGAGVGGLKLLVELLGPGQKAAVEWQDRARAATWLPQAECPAYPLKLMITSPGADAIVGVAATRAYLDLVVQTSRPVSAATTIGLVVRQGEQPNHYVMFPNFSVRSNRTIFRDEGFTDLPFRPDSGSRISFWAFATERV